MRVAFLGDVHGSVLHAIALLCEWTRRNGRLDTVIQLGDIGILPDDGEDEPPYDRFYERNKSIYDLFYLPRATGADARLLWKARELIGTAILFIQGNHDDQPQYEVYETNGTDGHVTIDPFGLFSYMPSGTRMTIDGRSILSVAETRIEHQFRSGKAEETDILVTHQGPLGIGRSSLGQVQGGRSVLRLVKAIKPRIHVFGHHHHPIGPVVSGKTKYIGLDTLVSVPRDGSESPTVRPFSLAVLDTDTMEASFKAGEWVSEISGNLEIRDLSRWINTGKF